MGYFRVIVLLFAILLSSCTARSAAVEYDGRMLSADEIAALGQRFERAETETEVGTEAGTGTETGTETETETETGTETETETETETDTDTDPISTVYWTADGMGAR